MEDRSDSISSQCSQALAVRRRSGGTVGPTSGVLALALLPRAAMPEPSTPAAASGLSAAQVAEFVQHGAVTVDTPLTAAALSATSAAMFAAAPRGGSASRTGRTCDYYDPPILEVIAHPWLEAVAKQVLGASAVTFFQTALLNAWPDPSAE